MLFLTNLIELRLKLEYNFGFKIQRKQYNIFPVFGSRFKENTTLKNGASFGGIVFGVRVFPRCWSAYLGRQGVGLHHSGPWGCSGQSCRSWRLSCIWRRGLTCSGFYLLSDHFTQGRLTWKKRKWNKIFKRSLKSGFCVNLSYGRNFSYH